MLYIDKATILKFDLEMLKNIAEQSSLLPCCCLSSGCWYQFPVRLWRYFKHSSGCIIICSGIALIVGLFSNRSHNFWRYYPVSSSQSPIYWSAISSSRTGAGHFCHCGIYCRFVLCSGVIRLMSWYRQRSMKGSWLSSLLVCWISSLPGYSLVQRRGVCNAGFHTGGNWTDI